MAAERTVLAWVRTALGFMASGVAVVYVSKDVTHPLLSTLGLLMVGLGCAIAILGGRRYQRAITALRDGGEMPGPSHVMYLIIAIVVLAIAIAIALVAGT
ncbi:DUF202 domain-containing protein [Gordonia sp. CPCC 205515]|uniref:YidH family protein n=1 Tax=Gordonia sp. CPCC 205515 TaxID=3140791 RepID=UPI003AF3467C